MVDKAVAETKILANYHYKPHKDGSAKGCREGAQPMNKNGGVVKVEVLVIDFIAGARENDVDVVSTVMVKSFDQSVTMHVKLSVKSLVFSRLYLEVTLFIVLHHHHFN